MEPFEHPHGPFPHFPIEHTGDDNTVYLWAAHCARLAYRSKYEIAQTLKHNGAQAVAIFDEAGTQAYVATFPRVDTAGRTVIVAFRGTEGDYHDILSDATFFKRSIDYERGFRVHGGFLTALRKVWGSYWDPNQLADNDFEAKRVGPVGLSEYLSDLVDESDELYFTGHSLGGALAHLAAYKYTTALEHPVAGIYTIGAPRTAAPKIANFLANSTHLPVYRIVNGSDIVPRVPPYLLGFRHFGTCIHLKKDGYKQVNPGLLSMIFSSARGLIPLLYRYTPLRFIAPTRLSAFADHSSAEYVRKLAALPRN